MRLEKVEKADGVQRARFLRKHSAATPSLNAAEYSDTLEATQKPLSATIIHRIVCPYQEAAPHRLLPEPEDTLEL